MKDNKLIAEFMDLKKDQYEKWYGKDKSMGYNISDFKYHSSWDWLMPVVEKIEQTKYVDEFTIKYCSVNGVCVEITPALKNTFSYFRRIQVDNTKIESTYKVIIEFIKWYKMNKK